MKKRPGNFDDKILVYVRAKRDEAQRDLARNQLAACVVSVNRRFGSQITVYALTRLLEDLMLEGARKPLIAMMRHYMAGAVVISYWKAFVGRIRGIFGRD